MRAHRLKRPLAVVAVIALGPLAPVARADVGETIILRCTHGESLAGFSQSAYRKALKELSGEADAEEYTNCASLIQQAELAGAGANGGAAAGAPAAALAATPAEQRQIARAATTRPAPLDVGGQVVRPGVIHANIASALSTLPSPLLAVLALLAAILALVGAGSLRARFRGGRQR